MIKFSVEFKNRGKWDALTLYIKELGKDGTSSHFILQDAVNTIADKAVEAGRNHISVSKKRPSSGDNLEKAIDKEIIQSVGGVEVGIGNIEKLKKVAPYFEVLNDGGYVPPANVGYFTSGSGLSGDITPPASGISGQQWVHTGKERGSFLMKPKKAIEGINYVGKMVSVVQNEFLGLIRSLGNKILGEQIKRIIG